MKEFKQEELIYSNYDDSRLKQLAQPKAYHDNSKLQYPIEGDPQTTIRPISKKTLTYTPSKRFLELACPKWPYFIYNGSESFRFIERDRLASPEDRAFGPEEVLGLMPSLKQIEVTRPSAVTFIPFWQSKKRKGPRLITFRTTVEETKASCPKQINTLALPRRNNMEDRKKEIEKANKIYTVSKSALEAVPSPRILAMAKPKIDNYSEVRSRAFVVSKPLRQKEKIQRDEKRTTRREKTKEINDYMLLLNKTKFLDKTKRRKSGVSGIKQVKQLEREMNLDTAIGPSEADVKQPVKPIAKRSKKLSASKYPDVSTQAQKANKDLDKESVIKKDVKAAKTKIYKKEVRETIQVIPRKSSQLPPSVSKLSTTTSSSNKSLLEDTEMEDEREGKEIKPFDKTRETKDREIKRKREEKEMKWASTSRKVSVKLYPVASTQEQKVDKDLGKQDAMKKDKTLTAAKTIKRKKVIRDVIPSKSSQVPLSVSKLSVISSSSNMSLQTLEFETLSVTEEFTLEKLKLEEVKEESLAEVSLTSLSEAATEITENLEETDIDVKDKEKELPVSAVIDKSKNGTTKNGDSFRDKLQLERENGKDTEITKVEQIDLTKRIEDQKNSTLLSITTESNMIKVDEGKQIVLPNAESKSISFIEAEDTMPMTELQFPTEICLETLPETELLKSSERKEAEEEIGIDRITTDLNKEEKKDHGICDEPIVIETEDMGIGIGSPYEKPLSATQDLAIKQLPGKLYESLNLKKEYTEDKVKTTGKAKETEFEKKSPPEKHLSLKQENDRFEEKVKAKVQEEYSALKGKEIEDSATKDGIPLKDTKSIEEEVQMPEEKSIEAVKDTGFLDIRTLQKDDTLSILLAGKTKSIGLEEDKAIRKQDIETIADSKEEKMVRENGMHFGDLGFGRSQKCMELDSKIHPMHGKKDTTNTIGECEYKDRRQKAKEPTAMSTQHETHNFINSKNLFVCPTLSSLCARRKELFNKIKHLPFQMIGTTKDVNGQNDIGLNIEALNENQDIVQTTEDEITKEKKRNISEIKQKESGSGKLSKLKYLIGATKRDSEKRLIQEKLDTSPIAKALFEAIQLQNIILRQVPSTGTELAIANIRMKEGKIARETFIKSGKLDKISEEKQKTSDISLGSKSQSTTDEKKNKKSGETLDKDAQKEISSATNETVTSITVEQQNRYSFIKEAESVSKIGENINAEKISVKEKNKIKDTMSIESESSSDQGLRQTTEEASLEINLTKKYIRRLSTVRRLSYLTPPSLTIPVKVSSSKFLLATAEDITTLP